MDIAGKTELDIFSSAPPQVVVESYSFEEIYPKDSIHGYAQSQIQFDIVGSEDDYIDLNETLLTVKIKAVASDGKDLTTDIASMTPSNYLLYTLFKDITLYLNHTKVEDTNDTYYQKAIIENALNFSKDTKNIFMKSIGFGSDTDRNKWLQKSAEMTLCGPVNLDFFEQPRYLIPGVNLSIKFQRNESTSIFQYAKSGTETEIKPLIFIKEAKLLIRRVRAQQSVRIGHNMGMNNQNAIYPIQRAKILQFSIPKGSRSEYKDNVFSDERLPKFVLITFQKTSKISGEYASLCSSFDNCNIQSISLSRGIDYKDTYNVNMANDFTEAYVKSLILNMGLLNKNMNNGISMDEFKSEYPFITFVLAPDFDVDQAKLPKTGNLKIDVRFREALTDPVTMYVYGVFDGEVQIAKDGSIII